MSLINIDSCFGGSSDDNGDVGANIFTSNDNITVTPASTLITDFSDILVTSSPLSAPDVGYDNLFTPSSTLGLLSYIGTSARSFRVSISGVVTSTSTGNDDKVFVRAMHGSIGSPLAFTGGTKRYSAGKAVGQLTSEVGFSLEVFGRFEVGDIFKIQLSKDFVGDITMKEVICSFIPISAGIRV